MRDITLIEQVQRRFTKRLRGYRNISYAERLRLLNLDTLEVLRLKFDLIYCYKIVFGLVRVNCDNFFVMVTSRTRGHPFKLYKGFSSSTRASFFSERLIKRWNRLSESVDVTSLFVLKDHLILLILDYLVKLLTHFLLCSFALFLFALCFVFVCVHLYGQLLVPLAFLSYGTLMYVYFSC